jgi:hypothetical protein
MRDGLASMGQFSIDQQPGHAFAATQRPVFFVVPAGCPLTGTSGRYKS